MKPMTSALIAAAALLAGATGASAATTVIDFNEYAFSGQGPYGAKYYTSLTTNGFLFTNSVNNLMIRATDHYANVDKTGAALTTVFGGLTRVGRLDGKAFNLDSFDFADYYNEGAPNISFQLTYFDGASQGARTLTYDAKRGLQTADLQLQNIQWFSINNTQAQLDNFRLSDVAVGGVPEPASWALMILGFGAAGAALRRRQGAATV